MPSLPPLGSDAFPQCVPMVGPGLANSRAYIRPIKPAMGLNSVGSMVIGSFLCSLCLLF